MTCRNIQVIYHPCALKARDRRRGPFAYPEVTMLGVVTHQHLLQRLDELHAKVDILMTQQDDSMTGCIHPPEPLRAQLFPPQWFVDHWNSNGLRGAPYATAIDPLVMMAWHLAGESARKPFRLTVPGC